MKMSLGYWFANSWKIYAFFHSWKTETIWLTQTLYGVRYTQLLLWRTVLQWLSVWSSFSTNPLVSMSFLCFAFSETIYLSAYRNVNKDTKYFNNYCTWPLENYSPKLKYTWMRTSCGKTSSRDLKMSGFRDSTNVFGKPCCVPLPCSRVLLWFLY